jgi:hypothetical protein
MAERSIAWLTANRNRKLRYRGVAKNDVWLHHRTAGLNLRRLLALSVSAATEPRLWPVRPGRSGS